MERTRISFMGVLMTAFLVLLAWSGSGARAATLRTAEEVAKVLEIRNVSFQNDEVSGVLVNKSRYTLREVQLQIRYSWRWKNEYKPLEDNAGDTVWIVVEKEIPAGGHASFEHKHPLPSRGDGYYDTSVSIAGYTEVIR